MTIKDTNIPDTIYSNIFLRLLCSPDRKLLRHTVVIVSFIVILITGNTTGFTPTGTILIVSGTVVLIIALTYLNMYLLIPRLLFKKKYIAYVLSVILMLTVFYFPVLAAEIFLLKFQTNPQTDSVGAGKTILRQLFDFVFVFGIVLSASTAVKLFQRWITDTYRISHLENARLHSELEQLKSQVNPHFLFNMLNNTNVLIQKDPTKASEVLVKLSDLLRYQLYDSVRKYVLLSADIQFLNDFLALEKIRRDHFSYTLSQQGDISGIQIPPFLLIGFVENAIKHNVDTLKKSFVDLSFLVEKNVLVFTCKNSKPSLVVAKAGKPGGLGLANARRRLELLYPGNHTLTIENEAEHYMVTLTLPL